MFNVKLQYDSLPLIEEYEPYASSLQVFWMSSAVGS